jgi:hypothetical protein
MRRPNRFVTRCGRNERHFAEVQIMKFTKPRDHVLTRPARTEPNVSTKTTLIEVVAPSEALQQAKGASA